MSARISAWIPEPADLEGAPAQVDLHAIPREGPLPPAFHDAEFVVPPHGSRRVLDALPDMPRLRVVQALSAGVEWLLAHVPPSVTVCTARGAYDVAVAEWVVAGVLADAKRLAQFRDRQRERRWEPALLDEVAGRHALIVGCGSIGRAVARRLEALGVSIQGVARRARPGVAATAQLPDLLPAADFVIVLVPHTPETARLFDAGTLDRMKPGALLVNAARGAVVDTGALLERLRSGRLRAVLDVTDPEPLPPDHPLWDAPGVTITPHAAGDTPAGERRARELLAAQLRRYAAGEPLANVVADGY